MKFRRLLIAGTIQNINIYFLKGFKTVFEQVEIL